MFLSKATLLRLAAFLVGSSQLASALTPPVYEGFTSIWSETFSGAAGSAPSAATWNTILGNPGVNAEWEVYTGSNANLQLSGGSTLQIIPRHNVATNIWTSARIESKYVFTPAPGEITRAEAVIQFGTNPASQKQGYWPAFWMLGDIFRNGGSWPACGEVDVLEELNGQLTGLGTAHCGTYPGGPCNETNGLSSSIAIPDYGWHTWRAEWNRTCPDGWTGETLSWSMDGIVFQTLHGSDFTQAVWATLAESPLYFILNLAIGGTLPGDANAQTVDGYGSMMEVGYVAVYTT